MEKEHQPDSMATIQMKPEYPPSEYSASEPPPAYRQGPSSSVQIARIAALTVVAASFILGSFILASSWVAARASCHQLEQLDAMLDKELALENKAYGNDGLLADEPLPVANAHALHGVPPAPAETTSAPAPVVIIKDDTLNQAESKIDEDKLQKIDDTESAKPDQANASSDESVDSDSSAEDEEELDSIRPGFRLPIQFDLDELAGAFLANNQQKGRMNCVVERRRDEPMERRFPFNILGAFSPRNAHAERIAIICHGGDEPRSQSFPEPQSQVFAFPLSGPSRLPIRPMSVDRTPSFGPGPMHRPAGFPIPMPWDSSEEQGNPREMRIHVQRVIAIPAPHNMPPPEGLNLGPFSPPPLPQRDQNEQPSMLHQFVPQTAPTQEMEQPEVQKLQMDGTPVQMNLPWGLTPQDLQLITRSAEEAMSSPRRNVQADNDMQEMKTIINTFAAAAAAESEAQAQAEEQRRQETLMPQDAQMADAQMVQDAQMADARMAQDAQMAQEVRMAQDARMAQDPRMAQEVRMAQDPRMVQEARMVQETPAQSRAPRTLLLPQELPMEERPHYMQPRSVRSVDALLNKEKRVKRCACHCGN